MTRVIKADSMDGPAGPRATVLHLQDLAAEAGRVVLDARKQAARILAEARGKAEAERTAAAERGFAEGLARGRDDGYADGRRRGLEETRKEFAATSSEMTALAGKITEQLRGLLDGQEARVLDFALALAARIVGQVAATNIDAAKANLAKVLELADGGPLVVRVNPAQLDKLRAWAPQLLRRLSAGDEVSLVADKQIGPGGVRADSATGQIDATIEAQMAHVVEALLGAGAPDAGRYVRAAAGWKVHRAPRLSEP